jgi:cytochrome c-type biogenesis protein CcmE
MNPSRRRRLWLFAAILAGVAVATSLTLVALGNNVQHFMSPTDIHDGKVETGRNFRLGGVVLEKSTSRDPQSLAVSFVVTDRFENTTVQYNGILPDLFREGQSVVATGALRDDGTFIAKEVLAKHDENYMPKEVSEAIARAQTRKATATTPATGNGGAQ